MLKSVPDTLRTKHQTDLGLVKSAGQVKIEVKPNVWIPYQKQYPLTTQAREGIRPTIQGLLEAGVQIPTKSQCSTPIFPVRKLNSEKWRLDLRAVNRIIQTETPIVPDPHTLLSNIPEDTKWYTYAHHPQGYCESPSIFHHVLAEVLASINIASTLIQ